MAPPRKQAGRGRSRRRVKKNIAIGQAHIKTSFNNTIVTLTDAEGARAPYFFLERDTVFFGPLRVRAFVFVRWPRTGRPRRCRRPR